MQQLSPLHRSVLPRILRGFASPLILAATGFLAGCDVAHPHHDHDHELIAGILIEAYSGTDTVQALWTDEDGPGGTNPTRPDTLRLLAGREWHARVTFFNVEDLGGFRRQGHIHGGNPDHGSLQDILIDAGVNHEVFWIPEAESRFQVTRSDTDTLGLPLGMHARINPAVPETANLRLLLKHKPGLKRTGDGPEVGATDADVVFPVRVYATP